MRNFRTFTLYLFSFAVQSLFADWDTNYGLGNYTSPQYDYSVPQYDYSVPQYDYSVPQYDYSVPDYSEEDYYYSLPENDGGVTNGSGGTLGKTLVESYEYSVPTGLSLSENKVMTVIGGGLQLYGFANDLTEIYQSAKSENPDEFTQAVDNALPGVGSAFGMALDEFNKADIEKSFSETEYDILNKK